MKNVAILVLGVLVSQLSFAQRDGGVGETEFKFGLKGAANIGFTVPGTKSIKANGTKMGFAYGVMGDFYFNPNYALSTELLISQINTKLQLNNLPQRFVEDKDSTVVNDLEYTYNLQYVEIPLSMKFRTKEIGNITYWGNFGFSPSILLTAKATIEGNIPQVIKDLDPVGYGVNDNEGDAFTTDNFEDKVFLFRFPLIVGGGIEYKMAGSTSLYGGLRYANSFTDILVKEKDANAKNNYVSINVGVFF